MSILVYVAFFAFLGILLPSLWTGNRSAEKHRRHLELEQRSAPSSRPVKCLLCDRALPRTSTSDEVVVELQRRIDADKAAVARWLREAPAGHALSHMYEP